MSDVLQKCPVTNLTCELTLCGEEGINFEGQTYLPDATRGYFGFQFSYAFPVVNAYGTGLHPNVIAASYQSMIHKNVNREHQLAVYHPDNPNAEDKVIGTILAAKFPQTPIGGWKVQTDTEKVPFVSGVAVMHKQCRGVSKLLGDHLSGKKKYAVSMEVFWPLDECGFAIALNGGKPAFDFTPPDMLAAGYEYVPWDKAPDPLRDTWNPKKSRVSYGWKGRKVNILMGGLNNPVHYAGIGVVQFGAEPPAKIMRLAAADEAAKQLEELFTRWAEVVDAAKKDC